MQTFQIDDIKWKEKQGACHKEPVSSALEWYLNEVKDKPFVADLTSELKLLEKKLVEVTRAMKKAPV
jgi:hypothetical protein